MPREEEYELVGEQEHSEYDTPLKRIPATLPSTTYLLALVEFAERASYYGVSGVFANFVQRPLPPGSTTGAPVPGSQAVPGALGMGLGASAAVSGLFTVMAFASPLVGGVLADIRYGKFRTIAVGTAISAVAHLLCVYSALPSVLASETAFMPFIVSVILLGGATGMSNASGLTLGLIKANIAPLMAEQYTAPDRIAMVNGERVLIEREGGIWANALTIATVQKIMAAYYLSINVGAFVAVASTFAEKYVGFWLAFFLPGVIFLLMPPLLNYVYPRLEREAEPSTAALEEAYTLLKRGGSSPRGEGTAASALQAVKLFLFFTVYNVADGGLNTLITSMAGSMTTNVPNDILDKANPLAIVISIPLLNKVIYPHLESRRIPHGPIRRVVAGFILASGGMAWCAILQQIVYATSPCGYQATTCSTQSPLSAWLILPAPLVAGLSESIAVVSALEIGYTMSPPGLRSIVTSLFLFTRATGAILVVMFIPIMRDPLLVWPFTLSAISTLIAGGVVWRLFKHMD